MAGFDTFNIASLRGVAALLDDPRNLNEDDNDAAKEALRARAVKAGLDAKAYPSWTRLVGAIESVEIMRAIQTNSEAVSEFAGGKVVSSKVPHYHLIPSIALQRIAARFELGQQKKKDKAWNACTSAQEVLTDKDWAIERLSHVIDHAMKLRDKLVSGDFEAIKADDDAGAIAWAGCFLIAATDALLKKSENEKTSTTK